MDSSFPGYGNYSKEIEKDFWDGCEKLHLLRIDLWKQLYISLVRPHLEFASSIRNPYHQADINTSINFIACLKD